MNKNDIFSFVKVDAKKYDELHETLTSSFDKGDISLFLKYDLLFNPYDLSVKNFYDSIHTCFDFAIFRPMTEKLFHEVRCHLNNLFMKWYDEDVIVFKIPELAPHYMYHYICGIKSVPEHIFNRVAPKM